MNKNGFVIAPIIIWIAVAAFAILAISKAGTSNNSSQTTNLQPSSSPTVIPTSASLTESNLIDPVKSYYSNVTSKNYYDAWNLLTKKNQSTGPITNFDDFVKDFNSSGLVDILIKKISTTDLTNHVVSVDVESEFIKNGQSKIYTAIDTWKLIEENGLWKLDSLTQESTVCIMSQTGNQLNIPKSVCDHSVDCEIGDKWIFYTSRDQCITDQQKDPQTKLWQQTNNDLTKSMNNLNSACYKDGKFITPFPAECNSAMAQFNIVARSWITARGGSTINMDITDLQNQIQQLQQKQTIIGRQQDELDSQQRDLDNKIRDQGNCNSSGGRWNGSWCSH